MLMLSVIIPVYNAERTIEKCVNSVIEQQISNMEIIIINDGSIDGSKKKCEELAKRHSQIKMVNLENGGVSTARNAGLDVARGKYIQFVDADDFVEKEMAQIMIDIAEKMQCELVMCGFQREFYHKGKPWTNNTISCENRTLDYNQFEQSFEELLIKGYINPPWNKLYLRSLITDNNRFIKGLSLGEDLIFNLEIIKKVKRIGVLHQPLYHNVEQNINSLTRMFSRKRQEDNKTIYYAIKKFCEDSGYSQKHDKVNAKIFLRTDYINLERLIGHKKKMPRNEYRQFFDEIILCKETQDCLKVKFGFDYECLFYKIFLKTKNRIVIEWSIKIRNSLKQIVRKMRSGVK